MLNGGPSTRSGAGFAVAVAPKPSAANAAVFELVPSDCAVAAMQRDRAAVDVDGVPVPVIESIFSSSV